MKALLIKQPVYEGVLAFVHGMGRELERFVVPIEGGYIVINTGDRENSMAAFSAESLDDLGDFDVLCPEADVPDDIVGAATAVVRSQRALDVVRERFLEALSGAIPEPVKPSEEPLGF